MASIRFFSLHPDKRFKNFHCHHFSDDEGCSYEFYNKFVQGDFKDSEPDFNPLKKAVFFDVNRQYEIYSLSPVLHISRGILVKEELYDFLNGYNMAEHCAFRGIKRKFEGKIYSDLIFLYFYRDYSLDIDFSNSLYWILRDGYYARDKSSESIEDYLIEDNINLSGFEDWEKKKKEMHSFDQSRKMLVKELKCPSVVNYDIFGFQGFSAGIFVSKRLRIDLEARKTKGLKFWDNIYFKFQV